MDAAEPAASTRRSGVTPSDRNVVARQLGRPPHAVSRVVARCPFGFPAAVEDLPYDELGTPFPTLFYLTCPVLVAGVSRLESAGGVRRWTRRAAADPALRRSLSEAAAATRRRRRLLARRGAGEMLDHGASLHTGVCGAGKPGAVKCLHAHVAHALAHPSYALGRSILAELDEPWCDDGRCAAFAAGAGVAR